MPDSGCKSTPAIGNGHPPAVPGVPADAFRPKALQGKSAGTGRVSGALAGAQKGQGCGEENKDGPNGCTGLAVDGSLAQEGTGRRTQFQSWLAVFIRRVFLRKLRCPSHSQKRKGSRAKRRPVRQPRPDKDDSSKRPGSHGQGCLRAGIRAAKGA